MVNVKRATSLSAVVFAVFFSACQFLLAQAPPPPAITNLLSIKGSQALYFTPYPAADAYKIMRWDFLGKAPVEDTSGVFNGFTWQGPQLGQMGFFQVQVTPLSSNALLSANVLNRIAYGPTPDLLDRLATNGAQAYIDQQLAPETIVENVTNSHPNVAAIADRFAGPYNYVSHTASSGPGTAHINDLRAWFLLHAVNADRQLLEVLTQFLENHFVTQYSKSVTYFNRFYNIPSNLVEEYLATEMEWREISKWREALLRPDCTFKDLLKISAESPAMIIYLDTVDSRGDGGRIANENYSREIMELFCMGVDNGYDQSDIEAMSPCWTGWRLRFVDIAQADNPFASQTTNLAPGGVSTSGPHTNLFGVWAFNFQTNVHATYAKTIFAGKTVPARFGEPYVSKTYGGGGAPGSYQLNIPARTGNGGIQDGYDIVDHLADLPFTQEFISVKLCRLFVHDDFAHGYDFTDPNLSPEGRLVRACMDAWENSNPKGQLRPVLRTIFQSDLFRSHAASMQKVKTPLEYTASAIRALRSSTNGSGAFGTFTAQTDGYALGGTGSGAAPSASPLNRMGGMLLFERSDPDGYPEGAAGWISAGTLAERVRFVQSLLITHVPANQSGKSDAGANNITDPVGLLRARMPLLQDQMNADKVADFFLKLIYPAEGLANLAYYKAAAVNYLNTADNGLSSSPFVSVSMSGSPSPYDTRVRGMVAMLLSFPRFQEQ